MALVEEPQKTEILIVDDEPTVRNVCAMVIRRSGYEPVIATDGIEGLNLFQERSDRICLVLSDVSMPQMDGIAMVRSIFSTHPHANVIIMSGQHVDTQIPEEFHRLCSVLEKPFTPAQLMTAVKKCLDYDRRMHAAGVS